MMKPSFDIVSTDESVIDAGKACLVVELGNKLFSYILYNKESKQLKALRHYPLDQLPGKTVSEAVEEIIAEDEILRNNFNDAIIIYNYPESNLVPAAFFDINVNKSLIDTIYGDVYKGLVLSEKIDAWDIYNVYRVPREIHGLVQRKFSAGKYWHFYTLFLSAVNKEEENEHGVCKLIFYPDRFIAAVVHDRKLQLLNTFSYETPEDVAYYVLSVARQLDLDPNAMLIEISGLIDEKSALYSELLKYFREVHCESSGGGIETSDLLESYPAHYFSPLLKLAVCVS
jgi:hypothetical protein